MGEGASAGLLGRERARQLTHAVGRGARQLQKWRHEPPAALVWLTASHTIKIEAFARAANDVLETHLP